MDDLEVQESEKELDDTALEGGNEMSVSNAKSETALDLIPSGRGTGRENMTDRYEVDHNDVICNMHQGVAGQAFPGETERTDNYPSGKQSYIIFSLFPL